MNQRLWDFFEQEHGLILTDSELADIERTVANAVEWHPRTDATPKGVKLWASDLKHVWEIWGDGKPISEHATQVLAWAVKTLPDPRPPEGILSRIENGDACRQGTPD